jgi:hypothetical protein
MAAELDLAQAYAHLSAQIPITGVAWWIPKSMIFVDTIHECMSISIYHRNGQSS